MRTKRHKGGGWGGGVRRARVARTTIDPVKSSVLALTAIMAVRALLLVPPFSFLPGVQPPHPTPPHPPCTPPFFFPSCAPSITLSPLTVVLQWPYRIPLSLSLFLSPSVPVHPYRLLCSLPPHARVSPHARARVYSRALFERSVLNLVFLFVRLHFAMMIM